MAVDIEDVQNETRDAVIGVLLEKLDDFRDQIAEAVADQVVASIEEHMSDTLDHIKSEADDAIDATEDGDTYAEGEIADDINILESYPDADALREAFAAAYNAGRDAAKAALTDVFDAAKRTA